MGLYLLDYGAGNVQSLANSLNSLGHDFKWISHSDDFAKATVSFFFFFFLNKFLLVHPQLTPVDLGISGSRCL